MTIKESIHVGTLPLNNRFVMPPMATHQSADGEVTDQLVEYYAQRAGKIGLIIMEHSYVSIEGRADPHQVSVAANADIAGLKRIVAAVHSKGITKIFAQISHAGKAVGYSVGDQTDIDRIIGCFADAALRVKEAGFDGVEIHAAHGYLLNQFYSPLSNDRSDAYNASSLDGRTKLTKEVIQAVRKAVGPEYPVAVRFGACDYQSGGSTVDEAPAAAKIYEESGADLIDVTGGMNGFMIKGVTSPGWFSDASAAIKSAVHVPVLLTGGIKTQEIANKMLSNGKTDLIGVGRPLLRNPDEVIEQILG